MAKGNWKSNVIKPKARCRLCGYVIKGQWVYINGCNPTHKECAERRGTPFTTEMIKQVQHA
jgi:hypothetical protein